MAKSDNLESLKDKRQQGNYRKATEQYIELLLEVVGLPPQELGYEFGILDRGKTIDLSETADRN